MRKAATSASFKKGDGKPRKPKGAKHKTTLLKEAFGVQTWDDLKGFIEGKGLAKLTKGMERLKIKDYAVVYLALAEYVKPKLQRTTIVGEANNPIPLTIRHISADTPIANSEEEVDA